ncbi:hypothetical protein SH1V18_45980 [Vallitalea longa]|uniref:Peptidase M50 domain-containing protein n=1 Tax=Vallitalea longa TaxID=2936439 RepID=A0A9W6DI45_9FIRM|nr:M50 family metallopeptidase [Vallitalea longa]GKX32118.1 hypothetical protein SH1V18_45980 [Vallitalea longa]
MIDFLIYGLVIYSFNSFVVLFHELGHAIFALLFTKEKVTISIGKDSRKKITINIKRLTIHFTVFTFWHGYVIFGQIEGKSKKILTYLGGVLNNILLIIIGTIILKFVNLEPVIILIRCLIYASLWSLIVCMIPFKCRYYYPKEFNSDMKNIIYIIKE